MSVSCPHEYAFTVQDTSPHHDQPTQFRLAFNSPETARGAIQDLATRLHLIEARDLDMLKLLCTPGAVFFRFIHNNRSSVELQLSPCSCSRFHTEVLEVLPQISWRSLLAPITGTLNLTTSQAGVVLETKKFRTQTEEEVPKLVSLMSYSDFKSFYIRDLNNMEVVVTSSPSPLNSIPIERSR